MIKISNLLFEFENNLINILIINSHRFLWCSFIHVHYCVRDWAVIVSCGRVILGRLNHAPWWDRTHVCGQQDLPNLSAPTTADSREDNIARSPSPPNASLPIDLKTHLCSTLLSSTTNRGLHESCNISLFLWWTTSCTETHTCVAHFWAVPRIGANTNPATYLYFCDEQPVVLKHTHV